MSKTILRNILLNHITRYTKKRANNIISTKTNSTKTINTSTTHHTHQNSFYIIVCIMSSSYLTILTSKFIKESITNLTPRFFFTKTPFFRQSLNISFTKIILNRPFKTKVFYKISITLCVTLTNLMIYMSHFKI